MPKIIGLTYNLESDYLLKEGDPCDTGAEFDSEETIQTITFCLENLGHKVIRIGSFKNLLTNSANIKADIVFNLAEGAYSRNRESQVPLVLEYLGIPYVGADSLTLGLALNKALAKKILHLTPMAEWLNIGAWIIRKSSATY